MNQIHIKSFNPSIKFIYSENSIYKNRFFFTVGAMTKPDMPHQTPSLTISASTTHTGEVFFPPTLIFGMSLQVLFPRIVPSTLRTAPFT